jgi:hypothetical protein
MTANELTPDLAAFIEFVKGPVARLSALVWQALRLMSDMG